MSYTIVRKRRVIILDATGHEAFRVFPHIAIFMQQSSCNNVSPRTYEWTAIGRTCDSDKAPNSWGGEIELPQRIWDAACAADMGSVKPYDRDISGVEYIRSWKKAAQTPLRVDLANLRWFPELSIYAFDKCDATRFHDDGLEAINRLPFKRGWCEGQRTCTATNREQLLEVLAVWTNMRNPGDCYLQDAEDDPFLNSEPETADKAA